MKAVDNPEKTGYTFLRKKASREKDRILPGFQGALDPGMAIQEAESMSVQAKRLDHFEEGIFSSIERKVVAYQQQGREVFNLSVGTPDFHPPEQVMQVLSQAALKPENYRYTLRDYPELRQAVAEYYLRRYGTAIDGSTEVVAVHGTQEGMGHLGMALCNPGDVVLLPNPGYPVFEAGAWLGEADLQFYPMTRENHFLPRLEAIPPETWRRTKYIVTSYPSNPTGAIAPRSFYEELIAYAKRYHFYIINDNAYSDIVFTEGSGFSFLSIPGAKEVGAEFFSLSKSFNLTGARLSFFVGNRELVSALSLLRSQLDFGIFLPLQLAAVEALRVPRQYVLDQCQEYRKRRDALCNGLREAGWPVEDSQGTMFVFAKLPKRWEGRSAAFCEALVDACGVVCTPGAAFGSLGEGYVRFALVRPPQELARIAQYIGASGLLA